MVTASTTRKADPAPHARLGAHHNGAGTTFALYSSVADLVQVCLYDEAGRETTFDLESDEGYVWNGYLPGVGPGHRYGFRVHGPWDPSSGARCNPAKLLLDPYARAIAGGVRWDPAVYGHVADDPDRAEGSDSAPYVPRSVVVSGEFDWGDDRPPGLATADSMFYEVHVKGFTKLHPDVPEELRGTYAGVAHPAAVAHLKRLGVTAVELLPVHQFVHDAQLVARGLRNYWGYQSIGYFAPHNEYSSSGDRGGQVDEFRRMVRALHAEGLEVILDVVFNHTAEADQWGPTLCFRGIDNGAYYRLADDRAHYVDDTGCGNTVDLHQPQPLRLVMDSLRYWVQEMHVDGFRFDLAAALGRGASDFDPHGSFLEAVGQDPVLSEVKLIAEPWDTGWGGYDLGQFPAGWSEWNGKFRDTVRDFWRGVEGALPGLATRISGSGDLFGHGGRRPSASVNIVTVHDGFTLADLVSFDSKHNEANGEDNHDGTDDNRSWNCGVEGQTDDPSILELRARQRRNFLATLFLSEGPPLLLGGDEFARSQNGNNNAYCQDDELTWFDWSGVVANADLVEFTARLCRLRAEHPVFRRRQFFSGTPAHDSKRDDLDWYRPDGQLMTGEDWGEAYARAVTVALSGATGDHARPDDPFLIFINAWWEPLDFVIPESRRDLTWQVEVDTNTPGHAGHGVDPTAPVTVTGRSLVLLRSPGAAISHSKPAG
ncbi:MAG TPA: glycogen debranching protein GlgX [Solirubrobacteraceae bacterium]|nr:glycogen debranching protein GlgX [Solirubrobacteraceae bacterium]